MKIKKVKYIGPVDSYSLDSYPQPSCYGLPIISEYDYSKNGAYHLRHQGYFNDVDINLYSKVSRFRYIDRI